MQSGTLGRDELSPETRDFYRRTLDILKEVNIPFLIGGAYALERYTGIVRHTKDFDVFLRPRDCTRALAEFAARGYRAELTFPHWLGKVFWENDFLDLIFSSGNGVVVVDDDWFNNAVPEEVLGMQVWLCPAEEMIWSKAFVMERERFDGADIAHLLRARAERLDWSRLRRRLGPHWRLLLAHLILYGYIYPGERSRIPDDVLDELLARLKEEPHHPPPPERVCLGTMLSRAQYLVDIESWGYQDGRLSPHGTMTSQAVAHWTAAIGQDNPLPPDNWRAETP